MVNQNCNTHLGCNNSLQRQREPVVNLHKNNEKMKESYALKIKRCFIKNVTHNLPTMVTILDKKRAIIGKYTQLAYVFTELHLSYLYLQKQK